MIKVVFFARLRELIGIDEVNIELISGQSYSVEMVMNIITQQHSEFRKYFENGNKVMVAVNQETSDMNRKLHSGDELAFFPPVTGG